MLKFSKKKQRLTFLKQPIIVVLFYLYSFSDKRVKYVFFYLGFLSRTFSIHRTAGEWGSHRQTFLTFFVFLVKVSYLPKFHVNIITGSGVMTISFYKGLTRNPEIGNTPV